MFFGYCHGYSLSRFSFMRKTLMISIVLSLTLGLMTGQAAPVADPTITKQDGKMVLLLPDAFLAAVSQEFPNYRIPNAGDLTGLWASNFLPYITWGDFDGDGATDIAVVLIKEDAWKEVIMHKTSQGYAVAVTKDEVLTPISFGGGVHSHQDILVRRIPKEQVQTAFGITFSHDLDSVEFSYSEKGARVYFWKNGEYRSLFFSE